MQYKDYYKIMGLERSATAKEIKLAYKKLARKYHPDVSKESDAEEKFKAIGEAYEVLKDKEKRAAYDQLGENWQSGDSFTPPPSWERYAQQQYSSSGAHGYSGFGDAGGEDFSDFFSSIFGRGYASQSSQQQGRTDHPGQDVHAKIEISIQEAYLGTEHQFSFALTEPDELGRMVKNQKTLKVKIPKGVSEGQHIRLAGQGGKGLGTGKKGDLLLEIAIAKNNVFQVSGKDVSVKLPIAPWEAALGGTVTIPTPVGHLSMNIPENSKSGQKLRLKGKGIPAKDPGDLFVVLDIVLPVVKTEEEKLAFQKMADSFKFQPRKQLEETANV